MREIETGSIFWFKSEGVGQEEQEDHPWVVVSTPVFHRKTKLVLAVPCSSSETAYALDVVVEEADFRAWPNVLRPLNQKGDKRIKVAKSRKVRALSVERVTEVVGMMINKDIIRAITSDIQGAIGR